MNTTTTTTEIPVTIQLMIRGNLGHDNKLFDRSCTVCKKGMYSSFQSAVCPKCGGSLGYIVSSKNTPMCISEGTLYPVLGKKTKEAWFDLIKKRQGMVPTFRFRIVSYMDMTTKIMQPPAVHPHLLKGALIEMVIKNHLWIPKLFQRTTGVEKYGQVGVEEMFYIYSQYGDTVKVMKAPQATKATVAPAADPNQLITAVLGILGINANAAAQLQNLLKGSPVNQAAASAVTQPPVVATTDVVDPMTESCDLDEEMLNALAAADDMGI